MDTQYKESKQPKKTDYYHYLVSNDNLMIFLVYGELMTESQEKIWQVDQLTEQIKWN